MLRLTAGGTDAPGDFEFELRYVLYDETKCDYDFQFYMEPL